ncbi:unnamed protein product [Peniophora sp. CBMAI 1063]|nr:unnamed protein product [Peniophora sp. CBMAI 1063]
MSAAELIEEFTSRSATSAALFVYDLAEQVGFGQVALKADGERASTARLQTRAGAGLTLVGRLSQSTSYEGAKGSVVTAYTTPVGISAMVPSLVYLPAPTVNSKLVLQVPTVTAVGESFSYSPTLASLNTTLALLPATFSIVLSATPQEAVDLSAAVYRTSTHAIHFFDHHGATRELGPALSPPTTSQSELGVTIQYAVKEAGYAPFEYAGDKDATIVLAFLNGPLALAAKAVAKDTPGVGVLIVRVLRPWDEDSLRAVLPSILKKVFVVEDAPAGISQGALFGDVFSALFNPVGPGPSVYAKLVTPESATRFVNDPTTFTGFLSDIVGQPVIQKAPSVPASKLLFFSSPGSALANVGEAINKTFAKSARLSSRLLPAFDVLSKPGGVKADRILLSSKDAPTDSVPLSFTIPLSFESSANFLAVFDQALLRSHSLLEYAAPGSVVLVVTSWTAAEFVSNIPKESLELIQQRKIRLCIIDAKELVGQLDARGEDATKAEVLVAHLAFLRLYFGARATEEAVFKVAEDLYESPVAGHDLKKINARVWTALKEVDLTGAVAEKEGQALKVFGFNAIAVEADSEPIVNGARLVSWRDAAKHLLFPSAFTPPVEPTAEKYPQNPALRPELPERTFLVTCTVNRRLTPEEYDRNVFHLEFDTAGTGLKYEIGEALGVHGWNDEDDVLEFCEWYGADPNQLIALPVPGEEGRSHVRTVFQALQQQIDLFGKPPKSFYSDLAAYTSDSVDKHALQFIGAAEGAATFKKLSEKDTVTFADVLKRYKSARPPVQILCELVGDIKPRHYSIASAQSVVGDRVDLLVVTVEWATPSGTPRFGQCTRYLAGLKIGQKVTVSIKPSVMKLPASDEQPLIMAGLGTGAAPFRAFLQHRAALAEKGLPAGPAYYYFGSRKQSEEYLYGEEIEAFIRDGVITKAGLAFSRDGPKKVYIQHKMLEDAQTLAHMLREQNGVFYLCGPTWPVPDVFEALRTALVKHHGYTLEGAADFLESLKEEERYVLEVY